MPLNTSDIQYLQQTYHSKKWSLYSMQLLLEKTSKQRRRWIQNYSPPVKEVLDIFPCYADPQIVSNSYIFDSHVVLFIPISTLQMINTFCQLSGLQREVMNARWLSCQTRLFKYVPLEHRKVVKAIVHNIETTSCADEGMLTINYNCFSVHCSL